jgi:hypothetical protein
MSMHMEKAYLTTTGKKKGKHKFRTVIHAQRARMEEESWKELQKRWGIEADEKKKQRGLKAPVAQPKPAPYRRDTGPRIASLETSGNGQCVRLPDKVYTGTAMIGIGQLHKSNAIPVFSKEDAIDISKMRRG